MEDIQEKITVAEMSHRSQEVLNSLRAQYLQGIYRSKFRAGMDLTYYPHDARGPKKGKGQVDGEKEFVQNPKFRFKALVRRLMAHTQWLCASHEEEEKKDDFAFNVRLLRKRKSQLSLLAFNEKMALLRNPSSRTNDEIQLLGNAFAKMRCFKSFEEEVHIGLAKTAELCCFSSGREVMRKGNHASGIYLITSGEASTLKIHLDCLTLQPSLVPSGSLGRGEIFGVVPLLYNIPRTVTVVTVTACEMVFWDRDAFNEVLLEAVTEKSNRIRRIIDNFSYFTKWSDEYLKKVSIQGFTNTYPRDSVILGKNYGERDCVHFVVEGTCSVIQRIDMVHGNENKHFIPELYNKQKIPAHCFIRTHYLEVACFRRGMAFNLGESWKNRVVLAESNVTVLLIAYSAIVNYRGRDNTWDLIKKFIKTNLPEKELLYNEYRQKMLWLENREKLREYVIKKYKDPTNTQIRDIPTSITHLLEKETIK